MTMTADACVWMYAVTAGDGSVPGDVAGVGGGPVRAVRADGLVAIVGDVAAEEFGAGALRRNLEDLDWLERTARAHHGVIEAAAEAGPVVPMQLATVCTSDAAVAATLRERAADLREALGRAAAGQEWGVKAYQDDEPPVASRDDRPGKEGASGASGSSGPPGPGAAYLLRRRAQLTAQRDARELALASAQAVHDSLTGLALSSRLYPPQSPDLTGRKQRMVLNAAYLVADGRASEFAAAVEDLAGRHPAVRLVLTGPWPPYSFVADSPRDSFVADSQQAAQP